jgi:hypothetical protein
MSEAPVFAGDPFGPLDCRLVESSGGVVRVVATGEIDMGSVPILDGALRDAHARGALVLLDLRLTHLAEQLEIVHDAAMILDARPEPATVVDRPL